jgi:hypothetical protein
MILRLRPLALTFPVLIGGGWAAARAADQASVPTMDAIEVMVDLTLIDGSCSNVIVNFGAGLRFAASRGVPAATILPGGTRRPDFDRVLRSRQASFGADELCGQIAKNYMEALPSSIVPIAQSSVKP